MPWNQGGSGGPWGGGSGGASGGSGGSGGSGAGGTGGKDGGSSGGSGGGSGGGGGPWGRGGGSGGGGNNNGGGPFGGGGRRPNDLEDLIKRSQDRVRRFLPSGGLGGKGLILGIVVLIGLWLVSGFYRVEPGEQGIVLRFGQWVNDGKPDADGKETEGPTGPGLHWHLPWPIETAETPNVQQVRQITIGFTNTAGTNSRKTERLEESLMLTQDQNIIDIEFTVQWRVANAGEYLFNLRDPELTIKAVAESAMREVMGQTDIQPALTEAREKVATDTQMVMQRILDSYRAGIVVTEVSLQDAQAPAQVIDAFEDVQRAQQDRDRARNEAETYRNKVVPEARGEAAKLIQDAEAYREQVIKESEGEAQRFLSVYTEYAKAPELTRQRIYIETLQGVLANTNKMILDPTLQGTVPYLPLNELKPRGTAQ